MCSKLVVVNSDTSRAPTPVVRLRPLRMGDSVRVRRWLADIELVRMTILVPSPEHGDIEPYNSENADRYLIMLMRDPRRRAFAIECDGEHVGNAGLRELDGEARTAECFIEIGEPRWRRRGIGSAAMTQVLDYAFRELGLVHVHLTVFEFNHPARRMYERIGFRDEGVAAQHWADDRYWDVIGMGIDDARWHELRVQRESA
jgi:RimJ/RimL family protein N-acetyltransferase